MNKNETGKWIVFAYGAPDHASAGLPITGDSANITANIRIDGAAASAVISAATELEDGYYIFDITATESNGDNLLLAPQSSTPNVIVIAVPGAVWTRPANFNADIIQTGDTYVLANGATGFVAIDTNVDSILLDTAEIGVAGNGLSNINLPNQTMDITGSLSGSVGSVTGDINTVAGTITNLDDLDTAQDIEHAVTQGLVSAISASPGVGARPFVPDTITVVAGTNAIGDAAGMANDDESLYTVDDNLGTLTLDLDYELGSGSTSIQYILIAAAQGISDNLALQFYDQVGANWDDIDTLTGANTVTYETFDKEVVSKYTTNTGLFQVRMTGTGLSSATLTINKSVAYGVAVSGGIANGSTIILSEATVNDTLIGANWNLALGGQDISGTYVKGASVTGISSGSTSVTFEDCEFGVTATLPPGKYIRCGFAGTFTAAVGAGEYKFIQCYSAVAGAASPILDFSPLTGVSGVNNRMWTGGSTYTLNTNCTLSHEVLAGGGTSITPADADVELRGLCRSITLNLADTDIGNIIQIIANTGDLAINAAGSSDSATVNIWGSHSDIINNSNGTVNDEGLDTGNIGTEINVQDIQARIPTALVSGRMDSNMSAIADNADSATNLAGSTKAIFVDLVATIGDTTSCTLTNTPAFDTVLVDALIVVISGNLRGERKAVTGYTSGRVITFDAMSGTLAQGDQVVII